MSFPIETTSFFRTYGKVLSLIATMTIGAFIPQAGVFSFLVQYFLMVMLFNAFLDLEIKPQSFQWSILWVLLGNLVVAFSAYKIFSLIDNELAMAAFITGIAPTAISSTVVVSLIHGRVDYMVAAILLTNLSIALIVPVVLPLILGASSSISTWDVLRPVLITMFVPLILARLTNRLPPQPQAVLRRGQRFTFFVWLINLFIISAKASEFIRSKASTSMATMVQIAFVALLICIINFVVGVLLGGRLHWQETSQALVQKNNSFAIWIALTFISPLVAMGPTFYVVFHNLYNTWQIYRFEKQNRKS